MKISAIYHLSKSVNLTNSPPLTLKMDLRNLLNEKSKSRPTQGMVDDSEDRIVKKIPRKSNSSSNPFREGLKIISKPNPFRERPIFPETLGIDVEMMNFNKTASKQIATVFGVVSAKLVSIAQTLSKTRREGLIEEVIGNGVRSRLPTAQQNIEMLHAIERDFRDGCVLKPTDSVKAANRELEEFKNEKEQEIRELNKENDELREKLRLKDEELKMRDKVIKVHEEMEILLRGNQKSTVETTSTVSTTVTEMDTEETKKAPQSTPAKKPVDRVDESQPIQGKAESSKRKKPRLGLDDDNTIDLTKVHVDYDEDGTVRYMCKNTLLRNINEPSLRKNIKNKTLFKDFRTGKSKQQVAEEVQEAKPSKFKKVVQRKSEKVLIITDSQGRVFEDSIKAEYRELVDFVMISGLTLDQGKKEKNLIELLQRTTRFNTKIQYDGVVIWAGGNDASKNGKSKYTKPTHLHDQISQVFQICAEKWPKATQCFIGIPPRTDVLSSDMADLYDLMDEWVKRGAEKKMERTYEDLYFPLYDEDGVDMKDGVHVREGCVRCKKALTNAIKKCVF